MFYLMCLLVENIKNFKLWESSKDKIKMLLLKMYTVLIVKKWFNPSNKLKFKEVEFKIS